MTTCCSDQICANKDMPSTCEVLDWYQCLELTNCLCINNECQWESNEEYIECRDEFR